MVVTFLALTFTISLVGFLCIVFVPGAGSPDSLVGLPFWLLTVWGPSLAAIILASRSGGLADLLARTVQISTIPPEVWLVILAPVALVFFLRQPVEAPGEGLSAGLLLGSILLNLILGPLGEELGWRGLMQDRLNHKIGWLEACLLVGVVWYIWHLPLWLIDSPQGQISPLLFGLHCMLYSVISPLLTNGHFS